MKRLEETHGLRLGWSLLQVCVTPGTGVLLSPLSSYEARLALFYLDVPTRTRQNTVGSGRYNTCHGKTPLTPAKHPDLWPTKGSIWMLPQRRQTVKDVREAATTTEEEVGTPPAQKQDITLLSNSYLSPLHEEYYSQREGDWAVCAKNCPRPSPHCGRHSP